MDASIFRTYVETSKLGDPETWRAPGMDRKYMKSTRKRIDDRFGDIFLFRNQLRVSHWQVAQLSFELFLSDGSESGLHRLCRETHALAAVRHASENSRLRAYNGHLQHGSSAGVREWSFFTQI